ncbi:hypothetical protein, partial [Escherichia coli]
SSTAKYNYSIRIDASQVTHYSWFDRKEYELMLNRHISSVKEKDCNNKSSENTGAPKKFLGLF